VFNNKLSDQKLGGWYMQEVMFATFK